MFNLKTYRKKMFVSSKIQGRLMLRIGLYWVLYHVVLWHALFVYRYIQNRLSSAMGETSLTFPQMYHHFLVETSPVIVCALITLPIVLIDMLHLTHRIAGPLVQFRLTLRKLIEGKTVEKVTLRKGDLLTEFQEEFNDYLTFLSEQRRPTSDDHSVIDPTDEEEARIAEQVADLRSSIRSVIGSCETESQPAAALKT